MTFENFRKDADSGAGAAKRQATSWTGAAYHKPHDVKVVDQCKHRIHAPSSRCEDTPGNDD
jgi:maltoporin